MLSFGLPRVSSGPGIGTGVTWPDGGRTPFSSSRISSVSMSGSGVGGVVQPWIFA
jgi:hypothetical protein